MVVQLNSASNDAQKLIVHKFGGSSLATAERFHAVADILLSQPQPKAVVVVSAPGDTTDHLLDLVAASEDAALFSQLHQQLSTALRLLVSRTLAPSSAAAVLAIVSEWLNQLPTWAQQGAVNDVLAIGERLSALLLSELLRERGTAAQAIDARDFLRLETTEEQQQEVQWQLSGAQLQNLLQEGFAVITGFIARDLAGNSITLGRNGSDYSATIIGRLVQAQAIHIWTDVDAIYSADPRKVPSAKAYRQVPWSQATRSGIACKNLKPIARFSCGISGSQ
jgi:aspartokinase/homoserine dehydrogenase 2